MKWELLDDLKTLRAVEISSGELDYLKLVFAPKTENYRWHPKYKNGLWDGRINFLNYGNTVSVGLWKELINFAEKYNFELELKGMGKLIDRNFETETKLDFEKWIEEFFVDDDFKPRPFQVKVAENVLKYKRGLVESATGSGKTLIMFMIFNYLFQRGKINKGLVIVPNVSLLEQTQEKFIQYNTSDKKIKSKLLFTNSKYSDDDDVNIYIGTFQTVTKIPSKSTFYDGLDWVCVDESHYSNSVSIKNIIRNCNNLKYRFGLSGTTRIKDDIITADSFTYQSTFGPLLSKVGVDELTELEYLTPAYIDVQILDYLPELDRKRFFDMKKSIRTSSKVSPAKVLQFENELIRANEKRFDYIMKLLSQQEGFTLILFQDVKGGYGKKIHEKLLDMGELSYYVDGNVGIKIRNNIRHFLNNEKNKNKRIYYVASIGTTAAGLDIPRLNNLVFAEIGKSEVMVKQSIGRLLRLSDSKEFVKIYDIADDFTYGRSVNYSLRHLNDRLEFYEEDGHQLNVSKIKL